jgi:hypothetical protein
MEIASSTDCDPVLRSGYCILILRTRTNYQTAQAFWNVETEILTQPWNHNRCFQSMTGGYSTFTYPGILATRPHCLSIGVSVLCCLGLP